MAAQGTGFQGLLALTSLLEAPGKASGPRTEAATRVEPHRGGLSFRKSAHLPAFHVPGVERGVGVRWCAS